ncbi:IS5 family transposase ISOt6 [Orientia tsutsugamushi]|uniref:IS5 family transposase ISOt6 n=1 Tax=Orientia tsutsugamushi TaxID=784 RepID=A0A2U3QMM5_ORITS|nr:DDE superendonuclease family protein [Orientia tsutsugamushi str. Karp]SPR02194.1 IS5 family transposase ISOt6 [Orientia tsutsugamushi]
MVDILRKADGLKKSKSWRKNKLNLKALIVVDKKTHQVICTDFSNGKKHDFRLFKKSKILIHPKVKAITDTGYQGIQKIHNNSELPKKKSKKNTLTKNDKK